MKSKLIAFAKDWLGDAFLVCGASAVTTGAGLVYAPAGWIVGGCFAIAAGVLAARGSK